MAVVAEPFTALKPTDAEGFARPVTPPTESVEYAPPCCETLKTFAEESK
jgi:hypothetical protein